MKFRKYLGKTPAEAIRQAQLERAKELLHATDRSIPAVARECGFVNTKHFARSFRMQVGTSPSAYRSTFRRA
jgi:transcriptional regulator GlxA family with amidase domain